MLSEHLRVQECHYQRAKDNGHEEDYHTDRKPRTDTRRVTDHDVGSLERRDCEGSNQKPQELSHWLDCMMHGPFQANQSCRNREDPNDDEEMQVQQLCQMIGEAWEQFLYPIIIDPGACASVMPTNWRSHVPIRETQQSQAGEYFKAANGERTYNEGQRMITMMTQEGIKRDMEFTVCGVSKALGSVSQMCKAGHRVVFNPPWDETWSYIEHVESEECMWLQEKDGLYVLKPKWLQPKDRQRYWQL